MSVTETDKITNMEEPRVYWYIHT